MSCGLIGLHSRLSLEYLLIVFVKLVIFQLSLSIMPIWPLRNSILTWHELILL